MPPTLTRRQANWLRDRVVRLTADQPLDRIVERIVQGADRADRADVRRRSGRDPAVRERMLGYWQLVLTDDERRRQLTAMLTLYCEPPRLPAKATLAAITEEEHTA